MLISAISDFDRDGLEPLKKLVKSAHKPDLLLLAGDIGFMGDPDSAVKYQQLVDILDKAGWTCPIIAVFGNHDSGEPNESEIEKRFSPRIIFLRNKAARVKVGNKSIGIVGSIGVLDSATFWQSEGVIGVLDEYGETIEKLNKLIKALDTDVKILLTHYAPTYKTLEGEPEDLWEVLGSEVLETLIKENKPNFAVHGHAHHGIPLAFIDNTPVFNVAYPVNKKIIEIDPDNLPKPQ